MIRLLYLLNLFILTVLVLPAQNSQMIIPPFTMESAAKFSSLALSCIETEYPNKLSHVLHSDNDVASPAELHPAFYGCFDWHSSVHGHWLLVKMLQQFPNMPESDQIIGAIDRNLSAVNIAAEIEYFRTEGRNSFERPYGWAWLLQLTAELANGSSSHEKRWLNNLLPLAEVIRDQYYSYLPGLYYPIRRGVHDNTAFGIAFAIDFARATGDVEFEAFLIERARFYYLNDRNIPASWEPGGDDFFSPSLIEADLMRRVLNREDFVRWFSNFLPELPYAITYPAVVADRNDPKGVHLDGLNLSRAWCLFELAKALPDNSKTHSDLWQAGYRHAAEALPNVISDNYAGTHWLATFAVYMYLSLADIEQ